MKALVTGGAGFIGSHLVEALVRDGHAVRVLDNFSTGKRENLAAVRDDVEIIDGDIRDMDTCRRACAGIDRVWHEAAVCSVPLSVDDPRTTHDVNITGTLQMLLAARDAGVGRLVFASSSAVYGADPQLPAGEDQPLVPVSPYALSKLTGEFYVRQFAALYGFPTVALRYFNIYGPRQEPNSQYASVVPAFFAALMAGRQPTIYGDGDASREFTYVGDCVQANLLAGLSDRPEVIGQYFNVAVGAPITVNQLFAAIKTTLGSPLEPHYGPERAGDVRYSSADTSKATRLLGFQPRTALQDGIDQTAAWFREWVKRGQGLGRRDA